MTPQVHDPQAPPAPETQMPAPRGGTPSYGELTAQQFCQRRDLTVVLLNAPHAESDFTGYRAVIPVPNGQLARHYLSGVEAGQPLGLVCPDGEWSARLAIRLARVGYSVFHMAGGLREWYRLQQVGGCW
jgi:hypothetical protein